MTKTSEWLSSHKPRREQRKKYILSKKDRPCADCGQEFPSYVMDFHHLDEDLKDDSLKVTQGQSMLIRMSRWSLKRIDEEISKCVVLCANCHRMRHGPS